MSWTKITRDTETWSTLSRDTETWTELARAVGVTIEGEWGTSPYGQEYYGGLETDIWTKIVRDTESWSTITRDTESWSTLTRAS